MPDLSEELAALRSVRDLVAPVVNGTDLHLVRRDDLYFLLDLVVTAFERRLETA